MDELRRAEMIASVTRSLRSLEGVSAALLSGSVARAEADEFSDLDVEVCCDTEHDLQDTWAKRYLIFNDIGRVKVICDIDDFVPYSSIGFYEEQAKLHLTFEEQAKFLGAGIPKKDILFDVKLRFGGQSGLEDYAVSGDLPAAFRPQRCYFWLNRATVGIGRGDWWQVREAMFELTKVLTGCIAYARGNEYQGLKRLDRYMSRDELSEFEKFMDMRSLKNLKDSLVRLGCWYLEVSAGLSERVVPDRPIVTGEIRNLLVVIAGE